MQIKYKHTNLIARDWHRLAQFYSDVFSCLYVPPERDFQGEALERGTGLKDAHLVGAHLRLPGWGEDGPTIEIFSFSQLESALPPAVNRPGWGHIAFEVEQVTEARQAVLVKGGSAIGEIVTLTTSVGSQVTWCYVTDPEGNIIELQSWSK